MGKKMAKKPTETEALEALDFIINVLKEHEKDLDKLITELGNITKQFGETGELTDKIERIENRLSTIQNEVSNLINFISTPPGQPTYTRGPPVIVRCRLWEDFKVLATNSEAVSFLIKEEEKTFQADALKEGRVLTYNGEFPRDTRLLKMWLSQELSVTEDKIFEGVLAIG